MHELTVDFLISLAVLLIIGGTIMLAMGIMLTAGVVWGVLAIVIGLPAAVALSVALVEGF